MRFLDLNKVELKKMDILLLISNYYQEISTIPLAMF